MRVLLANKFFYPKGGAEQVFFAQDRLLRELGHETIHLSVRDPDNEPSPWSEYFVSPVSYEGGVSRERFRAATRLFHSSEVARAVRRLVERSRPDLAVLHNVYHQLGPALAAELSRAGVPTILFLHDYKIVCPAYRLLRDGTPCEQCAAGNFWQAARHGCGGSPGRGVALAMEAYWQRLTGGYDRVDRFCAPSGFLVGKVAEMGFPRTVELLPNFVPPAASPADPADGRSIGYAGRLSHEKGVDVFLRAAADLPGIPFRIAGTGPAAESLAQQAARDGAGNVTFLGRLTREDLFQEYRGWRAAVVPSVWYENCPLSVLEPLSLGIPVIGSDLGGIPELLEEGGVTVPPGEAASLATAIADLWEQPGEARELGVRGRGFVERKHSARAFTVAFAALVDSLGVEGQS